MQAVRSLLASALLGAFSFAALAQSDPGALDVTPDGVVRNKAAALPKPLQDVVTGVKSAVGGAIEQLRPAAPPASAAAASPSAGRPPAPAPTAPNQPAGASTEDLQAQLKAMQAQVEALSKQVERDKAGPAPTPAPGASRAVLRDPKQERAELLERQRREREAQDRAEREARARAAEEQRAAAQQKAKEDAARRAEAAARAKAEEDARKEAARQQAAEQQAQLKAQQQAREDQARRDAEAIRNRPHFGAIAAGTKPQVNSGWAVDAITREKAESEALANCRRTGDTCAVVLVWTGKGCGAYEASKNGELWGAGVDHMISHAATLAGQDAWKRGGGFNKLPTWHVRSQCNSESTVAPAEMVFSGPPPRGKQDDDVKDAKGKGAQGTSTASAPSTSGPSGSTASAGRNAPADTGFRSGIYRTAGGYAMQVEASGDMLVIVEPNKRSEYRRIAPGSPTYKFDNEKTGSSFAMTIIDPTTLEASRFDSTGQLQPNGTRLTFAGGGAGGTANAVSDANAKRLDGIAQKYLRLAQTDSDNAQAWSFCGLAAMAQAQGQGDEQVQQAASALKSIATTSGSPCPDAISPAVWSRAR